MSNYDYDLENYLSILITLTTILSSTLFPIIVYLILTQSQQMQKYKYYLLYNIVWCYLFDLAVFLIRPSFLFPSYCVIFQPLLNLSTETVKFIFHMSLIFIVITCHSVVFCCFYRFSQGSFDHMSIFFENSYWVYLIYLSLHVFCFIVFNLPIRLANISDSEEIRQIFLKENPDLSNELHRPILCFVHNERSRMLFLGLCAILTLFFFIGNTLLFVLYKRIRASQKNPSFKATHKIQKMLFRALTAQLFVGYILLLFPSLFSYALVYLDMEHSGKFFTAAFCFMSFHCAFDYCTMLYFIKPYQHAFLKMFKFKRRERVSVTEQCVSNNVS